MKWLLRLFPYVRDLESIALTRKLERDAVQKKSENAFRALGSLIAVVNGARNYTEFNLHSGDRAVLVTVQKTSGKTPGEITSKALLALRREKRRHRALKTRYKNTIIKRAKSNAT